MNILLRELARAGAVAVMGLLAAVAPPALAAETESGAQSTWHDAGRVIAFADVHGAYTELTQLLRAAGVVDPDLHWSAGRTHVVSLGDLLDRGADSRRVMDLLMRLQDEARAAGGQLHVLVGNHEAMNILGDLRYVAPGEYAAFAADEPAAVRDAARAEWLARNGPDSGAAFDSRFPPGYFAHRAAFAPGGRYGRWLLGLPVAIAIDHTLFMHAGPSKAVRGMSVSEINTRYRTALAAYLTALDELQGMGLLREGDAFADRAALAAQRLAASPAADEAAQARRAAAVQRFKAADDDPLINVDGPNWYRGAALCNECAEADVLLPILDGLGVDRLVVGHTVARHERVATRFDGRVVKLDAGMNAAVYRGHPAALFIDGDKVTVQYADAGGPAALSAEPLHVAPDALDDAVVADALGTGSVTVRGPRAPGVLDVIVEKAGTKVPAVFVQAGDEAARRELAALRLDRLLRLGIVPATALREVQGQRGYVQARPAKWLSQAEAQKQSPRIGGWCALDPQFELVYAFDALSGNEGRSLDRLLLDLDEGKVLATGHDRAFGAGKGFPAYLRARAPAPGAELRRRLGGLDTAAIDAALGDLVGARERKALLERRDALLALPPAAVAGR